MAWCCCSEETGTPPRSSSCSPGAGATGWWRRRTCAARQGDKRILLLDGEPLGAINRVPLDSENRANMAVGGQPVKTELTARDREICARLAPFLRREGLIFVGIDVIGDWLTEVNVTSPTGLAELARLEVVTRQAAFSPTWSGSRPTGGRAQLSRHRRPGLARAADRRSLRRCVFPG
jgi:hypothetical protein